MTDWSFELKKAGNPLAGGNARSGILTIGKYKIETPVFMPVGTQGALKAFDHYYLREIGYNLILSNTYYMVLRPGLEILKEVGGLKNFCRLDSALLTDSGGFQAFSLSPLVKFNDQGIEFRSHIDGCRHFFTPEFVLEAQRVIGSDIRMLLDHVVPFGEEKRVYREALKRTNRWAQRSKKFLREEGSRQEIVFGNGLGKAFPILQGGFHSDLRTEGIKELIDLDFPGYAVGGLSVGEERPIFMEMAYLTGALLPNDKPRYIMGVGAIPDLLVSMDAGFDMFDCVLPTRNARNGQFMTSLGERNIRNARFKTLHEPIDPNCNCRICQSYSASYLHHLFKSREILAPMAATEHNLYFIGHFIKEAMENIVRGTFKGFFSEWQEIYPFHKGKRGQSASG